MEVNALGLTRLPELEIPWVKSFALSVSQFSVHRKQILFVAFLC